jgi:hypothetical protein
LAKVEVGEEERTLKILDDMLRSLGWVGCGKRMQRGELLLARAPTRPSTSALLYIPVVVAGTIGRTSDVAELVLALTKTVYVWVSDGEGMYGV